MNWEETIEFIRTKPEYAELVEKAYFERDLSLNVERFRSSEEYISTLALLKKFMPGANTILDIGSGNGISAIAFALDGYQVNAVEPDPSNTIGAGAIRILREFYNLNNFSVFEDYAENIDFGENRFDVVYVRQAVHHAYDLNQFITNLAKYIAPGGILLTIRDHVIYNNEDKKWFLESHPLHKFYGGENAFTEQEYLNAFKNAGLTVEMELKHYDSVINYFPVSEKEFRLKPLIIEKELYQALKKKVGFLAGFAPLFEWYKKRYKFSKEKYWDETTIPGRMYSFVARK